MTGQFIVSVHLIGWWLSCARVALDFTVLTSNTEGEIKTEREKKFNHLFLPQEEKESLYSSAISQMLLSKVKDNH